MRLRLRVMKNEWDTVLNKTEYLWAYKPKEALKIELHGCDIEVESNIQALGFKLGYERIDKELVSDGRTWEK